MRRLLLMISVSVLVVGCSKGLDSSNDQKVWERCEQAAQVDAKNTNDALRAKDFGTCMEDDGWTCGDPDQGLNGCTKLVDENKDDPSKNVSNYVENPFLS